MSRVTAILRLLADDRNGLTGHEIYRQLGDVHYHSLRVQLAQMVRRGFLKIDGKIECEKCLSSHNCYRITENGRIVLQYKFLTIAS